MINDFEKKSFCVDSSITAPSDEWINLNHHQIAQQRQPHRKIKITNLTISQIIKKNKTATIITRKRPKSHLYALHTHLMYGTVK